MFYWRVSSTKNPNIPHLFIKVERKYADIDNIFRDSVIKFAKTLKEEYDCATLLYFELA